MSADRVRHTLIPRFAISVRIAHWLLATAFAGMLGSGVLMGGVGPLDHHAMLVLHVASAIVLVSGLTALLVVRRSRRSLTRLARDLRPIDASDRHWLRLAPRAYLTGSALPRAGRFNAGQKVNARLVMLLLGLLYLSGLGELRRHVPALAPFGLLAGLHGLAAGAAAILVGFHVYLAVVHPTTRPALRGMTLGSVRRDWAEHHHADWVASLDEARDG